METITGFKVIIEIHCETEDEILAHLSVMRKKLKTYLNRKDVAGEISVVPVDFEDSNCYGYHEMKIENDTTL